MGICEFGLSDVSNLVVVATFEAKYKIVLVGVQVVLSVLEYVVCVTQT